MRRKTAILTVLLAALVSLPLMAQSKFSPKPSTSPGSAQTAGPAPQTATRLFSADADWNFWLNPPHMFSIPTGNVGIGTSTPTTALEVAGTIFSSAGGFQFPDGTVQATAAMPVSYAQVFTVALSGGDFITISAALTACAGPGPANRFLIRVMPGTYPENVTCKSYVDIQGAGKHASHIQGNVNAANLCTVEGFYIEGTVFCIGTSPTLKRNIITTTMPGDGVYVSNLANPWIMENEIVGCQGWGIYTKDFGTEAWIIANKIEYNVVGGIYCYSTSPTISNNMIRRNNDYGIFLTGAVDASEPTIDDNVIGHTQTFSRPGTGIYMEQLTAPRIIANDIYLNEHGIEIQPSGQPSINANNINYNIYGIRCFSSGATQPVTITGNHIHANYAVGVEVVNASPRITQNNIAPNDPISGINPDLQYAGPPFPIVSLNVFDRVTGPGTAGLYNVTSMGLAIAP